MSEPKILNQIHLDGGATVVLYDWMEVEDGRNLIFKEASGQVRWRAKPSLAGSYQQDCFTSVDWDGKALRANTFSCFRVAVDMADGSVTELAFTK
jgi:hypothetical protein